MLDPAILAQILWTGIATSSPYVLMTIGFALTLKVTGLWNFAHAGLMAIAFYVMFFVLNGVGLLFQYVCIWIVQDVLGHQGGLWYNVANLIGIVFGTLFRFWSYRKWVWHMLPPELEVPADALPADPSGPMPEYEPENRGPAFVPPESSADRGGTNGNGARPGQPRPEGPRHARSR